MILLLAGLLLLVGGIALCGYLDGVWTLSLRRLLTGLLLAFVLSSTVVYAATVRPTQCWDLEKYSFLWYWLGCFFYEGSS